MEQSKTQDILRAKVCVLSGGWSDEREISLTSGKEVASALDQAGFANVDFLDVSDPSFVDTITHGDYDVAFVAMHGRFGEDGCIQGLLEVLHIPYTFSGVLASSMAMAKDVAKTIYRSAGIPVARDVLVHDTSSVTKAALDEIVETLGLPLFVKPTDNGSSFGISLVRDSSELSSAIEEAAKDGCNVLIEQAVEGVEITVPVIGNEDAQALPIIEVDTGADFYDETVKYEPSYLHHVIPARLDEAVLERAGELAVAAHLALGCRGCSRSDFIVRDDGTPVILETNTIPGMTAASLLPDSARSAGIDFPALCRRFVELALS